MCHGVGIASIFGEKRPILCVTEMDTKKAIPVLEWGLPESVWVGICQYSKSGSPRSGMGFIPTWGPAYILLWFFQRDQWNAYSPMHTVIQSQQFSISIPTYQLETYHMFTIPYCTQVNLHKKKKMRNNYELDVL